MAIMLLILLLLGAWLAIVACIIALFSIASRGDQEVAYPESLEGYRGAEHAAQEARSALSHSKAQLGRMMAR